MYVAGLGGTSSDYRCLYISDPAQDMDEEENIAIGDEGPSHSDHKIVFNTLVDVSSILWGADWVCDTDRWWLLIS